MTPQIITEYTKKHGTSFLLICAIFWLNNRLANVEAKLYDCLEDHAQIKSQPIQSKKYYKHDPVYAVLTKQTKYDEKFKRKMEG